MSFFNHYECLRRPRRDAMSSAFRRGELPGFPPWRIVGYSVARHQPSSGWVASASLPQPNDPEGLRAGDGLVIGEAVLKLS